MAASNAKQLNMGYSYFPTAMLAKMSQSKRRNGNVKDDNAETVRGIFGFNQAEKSTAPTKDNGAAQFIPKNGSKRYSANQLAIINLTHKMRSTFADFGKLTHALFERQLNLSHVTVNHNLAQLRKEGILQRENGVNDYCINPDIKFSEKSYIVIYNYLFDKIDLGREAKKLNFNAVILLCFIINRYFEIKEKAAKKGKNNIKPEDAYFVGGKKRVATLLNVAESTANDAVWELLRTAAIYRKAFYIDDNCQEVICDGKGNSGNKQTVYILNSKIIRLCEKVRAKMDKTAQKRAQKAEKAAQRAERQEAKNYKQHSKKARNRNDKAAQRQRDFDILKKLYNEFAEEENETTDKPRGVVDEWASTIEKMRCGAEPPEPFEEFTQHDNRPPTENDNK